MDTTSPDGPPRTRRGPRLLALLAALVLACVAMSSVYETPAAQAAGPAPFSSTGGHHVVHDMHCEPFTGATTSTAPAAPSEVPVVTTAPVATDVATAEPVGDPACAPSLSVGSHPPGRALLLTIGVDRN